MRNPCEKNLSADLFPNPDLQKSNENMYFIPSKAPGRVIARIREINAIMIKPGNYLSFSITLLIRYRSTPLLTNTVQIFSIEPVPFKQLSVASKTMIPCNPTGIQEAWNQFHRLKATSSLEIPLSGFEIGRGKKIDRIR